MLIGTAALAVALLSASVVQAQQEQYLVVAAGNDFPVARVQAVQQAGGQGLPGAGDTHGVSDQRGRQNCQLNSSSCALALPDIVSADNDVGT